MSQNALSQPAPTTERRLFVRIMIAATVLMFLVGAGLLCYRWVIVTEPTSDLIVIGHEGLRGAEVEVEGVGLLTPYKATIGDRERLALPFYLDRGSYTLTVTMNGERIYHLDFSLPAGYRQTVDLTKTLPPVAPSAEP